MSIRTACLLVLAALATRADVVDLGASIEPARAERLVGEQSYDVWNAGLPPEGGVMVIRGRKEGDGYLVESSLQMPDGAGGVLFVGEAMALGADLRPTGYARSNHVGESQVSALEMRWGPSGVAIAIGEKTFTLDAATLPDAILPHWLSLVTLDAAKAYRTTTLSFAHGPHAAPAILRCDGVREWNGGPCARWSLRLANEDPTAEWKWWVDEEGVVAFRSGAYQGVRKGVAEEALPLDGELDPRVTFRMTPRAANAGSEIRQFTFEDATYRRGAVVAMKTQYTVEECTHGRVMDVQRGDRVVGLLRHFSLGNPTRVGDEWSVTLALSLPNLHAGRSFDLAAGQAEAILHYGSRGPQTPGELIARQATGHVKVLSVDGATIELDLALSFEGQVTGANLGSCRFDVQGKAQADLVD